MTEQDVTDWLRRYGDAWVGGDPDAVVRLFTADATYRETPFDEPMRGADAIRAYWREGAADGQTDVSFSSTVWGVRKADAFAHWKAAFTRVASGRRVELDGSFHLTLVEDGGELRCAALREWWHRRETD